MVDHGTGRKPAGSGRGAGGAGPSAGRTARNRERTKTPGHFPGCRASHEVLLKKSALSGLQEDPPLFEAIRRTRAKIALYATVPVPLVLVGSSSGRCVPVIRVEYRPPLKRVQIVRWAGRHTCSAPRIRSAQIVAKAAG